MKSYTPCPHCAKIGDLTLPETEIGSEILEIR